MSAYRRWRVGQRAFLVNGRGLRQPCVIAYLLEGGRLAVRFEDGSESVVNRSQVSR